MSSEKIIAALPHMTPEMRATVKANAERHRDTGSDVQRTAAREVLAALEQVTASEVAARRELLAAQGVKAAIVDSFGRVRMTETEEQVIRALLDYPASTSDELSRAIGWGGQSWHLHFGTMCVDRFAAYVGDPPPDMDKTYYSYALADCDAVTRAWTMKADAVAGFAALEIRSRKR